MPGKRKQSAPRKADEQKRQCLAWNMQDMFINNSATTDTDQMVAGPSSSHEPSQVIIEHRQTISQSDVLHDSMSSIDQSNGIHADQSLVSEPSQVIIEHGHISSQSNGFLESMSNIDQSNGQHTSQSLKSEVLDVGHKEKSVRFDEFSVVEIDIASSPPNVGSLEYGIDDTDVVSALNDTVLTNPADGHDFFLTMFDSVDDAKWHCSLGTIVLNLFSIDGSGKLPKVLPPMASPVLYVFEHTEKHVLHLESLPDLEEMEGHTSDDSELEEQEQDLHVYATTTIGVSILSGLAHMYKKKAARLVLGKYDPLQGTLDLHLYLLEEALSRPQFASESLTGKGVSRKLNRTLQELMEWFLGIPIPESYSVIHKKRQDVEGLYRHVREAHQGEDRSLTLDPQHHLLVPSLRPYQKEAVLWMLEMEQFGEHLQQESRGRAAELHFLWREVQMPDGQILFFNSYTGSLCKEKQCGMVPIPGGILADEMGLGKTVEALALMLLHPRPGLNRTTSATGCAEQDKNRTAVEQPKEERQEIQDQQQSTSSTDARQPKCQKKSSKKTASNSKSKGKKSKKGLAVVEPVCIPAPDSCNVQSTQRFECICGVTDAHVDSRTRLQCWQCGNWQHAECVNYNATSESDPAKMAEPYHCPHCSVSLPAVPSGATLIISPAPISHQWVDEINRHVRKAAIKMLVYSGVKKQGFLQPKVLADHDIVITTYDVLRLELNYVDIPHSNSMEGRRLRQQKRYMAVPSPLPSVEWWRVCLDEAQMVECTTAKAAEMALRLSAVNRWCVTGTPIQRNLEDLYGLLLFLGVDPYWVKHWWERLLYQPYCHGNPLPMYEVISKVMWRTAKKDVLDQINLPQQTEDVHWLKFSPVEEHFYRRKHEDCSRHAFKVLSQWHDLGTKLCQLDRRTMQTMLWPLLKLRQACCHPQAVRGEFLPLHKSTMTMDELLKSLTQKCKIECEEAHRQLICALNGLAGIHIIKEEYPEAVEKYREVLRSVQEHEGRLKTDKLQRLHTLHNLAGLLHRKLSGVAPTLRDDQLMKQAEELKTYYMQKSLDKIHSSQQTLLPIQQKVQQLRRKLQPGTPWWMDTLQWAIYWGKDEDLAERIRNELSGDRDPDATSIVNKFRDLRGLQFLLTSQLENLQQSHSAVCTAVNHLSQDPAQRLIQSAVECHLRPEKGEELHTCEFCKADDLFLEYESRLFSFTAKRLEDMVAEEEENPERQVTRRGVWAQSETEKCLKIVLSFCKSSRLEEQWVEEGNMQVELFEQLRREYKQLHVVWMALRDRVAAIDELDMATTRLRLRLPEEERTDPPQPNIIEPGEVDHQWIKNLNDKAVATSLLHRKLGQLLYLKNLAKSQEYQKDGVNPEPCPICQRQLGTEWSVLMCGHCFCEECISVLVNQFGLGSRRGSIRCAICRQLTATGDISYVSTEAKQQEDVDVKGSHSTKVEAVVRTLKLIRQKDPTAKSLVFSTWQDVLDVVATALRENNMEYRAINGIHRFQENITDFKYDSGIGVLLLPLHTGSHGLNIIEATHVLLVEPIINPAQEAQAIGRVHRIGQTKATVVHRFLVQNTIEERIHAMKKHISASDSIDTQSEGTVLTVGDLRDLFSDAFHHREDDSPPPPQQEYDQNNGVLEEFDDGNHHPADGPPTP
uniref:RING-type domain-containing protein n=1 Tax=Branchiostoma floridae TaxID=7739 RepID=C3YH64_BRAFL|eukprot:XP_002604289.1 hypothetical protein BRAFLDRAFT_125252 [Branchiostoma floridae]